MAYTVKNNWGNSPLSENEYKLLQKQGAKKHIARDGDSSH